MPTFTHSCLLSYLKIEQSELILKKIDITQQIIFLRYKFIVYIILKYISILTS